MKISDSITVSKSFQPCTSDSCSYGLLSPCRWYVVFKHVARGRKSHWRLALHSSTNHRQISNDITDSGYIHIHLLTYSLIYETNAYMYTHTHTMVMCKDCHKCKSSPLVCKPLGAMQRHCVQHFFPGARPGTHRNTSTVPLHGVVLAPKAQPGSHQVFWHC